MAWLSPMEERPAWAEVTQWAATGLGLLRHDVWDPARLDRHQVGVCFLEMELAGKARLNPRPFLP